MSFLPPIPDVPEQAQEASVAHCYLCTERVSLNHFNEFMILILQRNEQSNRLIFHTECFFSAAGSEYKKALKYDQMLPKNTSAYEREKAIDALLNRAQQVKQSWQQKREDERILEELKQAKQQLEQQKAMYGSQNAMAALNKPKGF